MLTVLLELEKQCHHAVERVPVSHPVDTMTFVLSMSHPRCMLYRFQAARVILEGPRLAEAAEKKGKITSRNRQIPVLW